MWGYLLVAAAAGGVVYYYVTRNPKSSKGSRGSGGKMVRPRSGNWCVAMYKEDPRGVPAKHRRLSHSDGPFATKAEAEARARKESSVWYPRVRKCHREDRE